MASEAWAGPGVRGRWRDNGTHVAKVILSARSGKKAAREKKRGLPWRGRCTGHAV